MDDSLELAEAMARVATELLDEREERPTVDAIVKKAVEVVPGVDCASITIRDGRHFTTLAATTDTAREADHRQYDLAEGPCIEALEAAEWIRSGGIGTDPRWPRWGPTAALLGLGSLLSVPLFGPEERIGSLNMYSFAAKGFTDRHDVDLALLYALHAARALASARLVSGLEVALSSRHGIGIAQGMLVERYGLSVEQSFDLLRRVSSVTNVKLVEVARHITETGDVPTVEAN